MRLHAVVWVCAATLGTAFPDAARASEKGDWAKAEKLNTVPAYEEFLQKHGSRPARRISPLETEARSRIARIRDSFLGNLKSVRVGVIDVASLLGKVPNSGIDLRAARSQESAAIRDGLQAMLKRELENAGYKVAGPDAEAELNVKYGETVAIHVSAFTVQTKDGPVSSNSISPRYSEADVLLTLTSKQHGQLASLYIQIKLPDTFSGEAPGFDLAKETLQDRLRQALPFKPEKR
jgi:hypothetical protein